MKKNFFKIVFILFFGTILFIIANQIHKNRKAEEQKIQAESKVKFSETISREEKEALVSIPKAEEGLIYVNNECLSCQYY
jgi:flagellar biosynthesis component FlhA